ncbi:hypothetical protein ACFOY2_00810 [Nonomuraea purpurea]|uniref:Uncharacterized protein n=1 Tax=Nonomuraea purpurea TaxID=1849276 RepID=A0ABV8G000_9ACTN
MGDQEDRTQQRITERLKEKGWVREPAAERFDWPDFAFDNTRANLEFFYSAADDWVCLGLLTQDQEGHLRVHFGDEIDSLLDAVIAAQQQLDADHWDAFIEILLAIPLQVYAITGEDEDDVVELRSHATA